MTSNIATGTYTGALTDTTNVATGMTDIQSISAGFKQFSDLFATSLPSETNATLRGLFDSATFLDQGQNLDSFLSEITTDKEMIGISFTNISIQSMDVAKGTATVAFTVLENGKVSLDAPVAFYMIKKERQVVHAGGPVHCRDRYRAGGGISCYQCYTPDHYRYTV